MKKIWFSILVTVISFTSMAVLGSQPYPDIALRSLHNNPGSGTTDHVEVWVNNVTETTSAYRILIDLREVATEASSCYRFGGEDSNCIGSRRVDDDGLFYTTVLLEPGQGIMFDVAAKRRGCGERTTYGRVYYARLGSSIMGYDIQPSCA